MGGLLRWLLLGCVVVAGSPAAAVTFERQTTDDNMSYLLIAGEFRHDDSVADLVATVTSKDLTFVTFNSPGGSVSSAMRIGRAIRALGLNTLQIRELACESACALAFVGGVHRVAAPGAIGVHRTYFAEGSPLDRDQAVEASQHVTGEMLAYLRDMGVDPELLQVSLQYSRDDMRYLSASEMTRMRVTTEGQAPEHAAPTTSYVAPSRPTPAPPAGNIEQEARTFVEHIINYHMLGEDTALRFVSQSYGQSIQYYGKTAGLTDVVKDKQSYFQRWPERAYRVQPGSVTTTCSDTLCEVSGYYDWAVRSYPRNRQASGTASFQYWVNVQGQLRIVGETSEVVGRN